MSTKTQSNLPFAHLLRASPAAIAAMQEVVAASIQRDREEAAEQEAQRVMRNAQKVAAQIVAANNKRLGLAPPPTPTTALGRQIVSADKRRRGE
jgi:hypothetical protein